MTWCSIRNMTPLINHFKLEYTSSISIIQVSTGKCWCIFALSKLLGRNIWWSHHTFDFLFVCFLSSVVNKVITYNACSKWWWPPHRTWFDMLFLSCHNRQNWTSLKNGRIFPKIFYRHIGNSIHYWLGKCIIWIRCEIDSLLEWFSNWVFSLRAYFDLLLVLGLNGIQVYLRLSIKCIISSC